MIRNIALVAAATFAAAAPAAAAPFDGPRVGAVVGFADDDIFGTETFTFGANVGYDVRQNNSVGGFSVEYQNSSESGRELSATLRAGGVVGGNVLVYALGGYTNLAPDDNLNPFLSRNLDGVRAGVGLEFAFGESAFVNVEQRYSNYAAGVDGWQTVAGVGFRF